MNMHLRALRWEQQDVCVASFDVDGSEDVVTRFQLQRDKDIIGAVPDWPIFNQFDGTAAEVRLIISAVVRFCLAAQGEISEGHSSAIMDSTRLRFESGFELSDVIISKSEVFEQLQSDIVLPKFVWLEVTGAAGIDDLGVQDNG